MAWDQRLLRRDQRLLGLGPKAASPGTRHARWIAQAMISPARERRCLCSHVLCALAGVACSGSGGSHAAGGEGPPAISCHRWKGWGLCTQLPAAYALSGAHAGGAERPCPRAAATAAGVRHRSSCALLVPCPSRPTGLCHPLWLGQAGSGQPAPGAGAQRSRAPEHLCHQGGGQGQPHSTLGQRKSGALRAVLLMPSLDASCRPLLLSPS